MARKTTNMDIMQSFLVNCTQAGIQFLPDISNTDYHAGKYADYFGHSKLLCARYCTPAKIKTILDTEDNSKRSDALILGSLFHTCMELYNPDTPEINLPDGYIIKEYDSYQSKAAREWRDEVQAQGLDIVSLADWIMIQDMVLNMMSNPTVRDLYAYPHYTEPTILCDTDLFDVPGMRLKIRPDMLCFAPDKLVCVDWKTCDAADLTVFERESVKRGYTLQAWLYRSILSLVSPVPVEFWFVAIEKSPPYQVAIYNASDSFCSAGEDLFYETLRPRWLKYLAGDYTALYDPGNPIIDLYPPQYLVG